jgi:hypothetical protein
MQWPEPLCITTPYPQNDVAPCIFYCTELKNQHESSLIYEYHKSSATLIKRAMPSSYISIKSVGLPQKNVYLTVIKSRNSIYLAKVIRAYNMLDLAWLFNWPFDKFSWMSLKLFFCLQVKQYCKIFYQFVR